MQTDRPILLISCELGRLNAILYSVKTNMFNDDYMKEDVEKILFYVYSQIERITKELDHAHFSQKI